MKCRLSILIFAMLGPSVVRADERSSILFLFSDDLPRGILCMVLGCALVYAALFATDCWLYRQVPPAVILSIVAVAACFTLFKLWERE